MKKIAFMLALVFAAISAVGSESVVTFAQAQREYQRIVIASDLHYPSKIMGQQKAELRQEKMDNKLQAAADISSWPDVDLVAFLGDMVPKTGSVQEYKEAKLLTDKIKKPQTFVAGNHEFYYQDDLGSKHKLYKGTPESRQAKLEYFKQAFATPDLYYSKKMNGYRLIFLSANDIYGKYAVTLNSQELRWLKGTLQLHKQEPTVIFCHAPLENTMQVKKSKRNSAGRFVQPAAELKNILMANPQIMLWVSGHTHTAPTNENFAAPWNCYENKIWNIYNPTWDGKQVWTNSLYLYPDKIMVKTYDHKQKKFLEQFTRSYAAPHYTAKLAA